MGTDDTKGMEALPCPRAIKVHRSMCIELLKVIDRISKIFPEIEAARPRCLSGLQELCSLNSTIEKAKSLLQQCSESSKLYLALTGDVILSRCKKSKNLLEQSLSEVQNMVPVTLAAEISPIISDLRAADLRLDSSEEEAGKVIRAYLLQYATATDSIEKSAIKTIQFAAVRLYITSQKALLIEKRSIKKLLDAVGDGESTKKRILLCLLNLLKKHGQLVVSEQKDDSFVQNEDFVPVSISCNRSVELESRVEHGVAISNPWIQSKSVHLLENSSTSISSLGSSLNGLQLPIDCNDLSLGSSDSPSVKMTSGDSHGFQSFANTDEIDMVCLSNLDALSWDSQCKAVEGVKIHLKDDDEACFSLASENFVEQLVRFLKDARDLDDVKAQRTGSQLLFAFVSKCRRGIQYLHEDAYTLLASFLVSEITEEALAVTECLSRHKYCISEIAKSGTLASLMKILDTQIPKISELAIKILHNVSCDNEIRPLVVSLNFVPKLVPFFDDSAISGYCITFLRNLCDNEVVRNSIAETDGCIASIVRLLEVENHDEDQELAVVVLLSLCSQHVKFCRLVMDEGVIPSLVSISNRENEKGKGSATELLRVLKDTEYNDRKECSVSDLDISKDSKIYHKEKKLNPKTGIFGVKISIFSNLRPKKKK